MTVDPLLDRIDAYCDAVPRTAARAEAHGPLTLFVNDGPGWSFYARPTRGTATVTPTDVDRVPARQRQLGIPETFEWIAEVTPSLGPAARAAGLAVTDHPLLVLEPAGLRSVPRPAGVQLRLVGPDDDLAAITAVAQVGFASPGTATGPVGAEALRQAAARQDPAELGFERARLQAGLTVLAVALLDGQPAAVGSHQPVGPITEVVGVTTLPVWRRRGLGAAVTALLIHALRFHGAVNPSTTSPQVGAPIDEGGTVRRAGRPGAAAGSGAEPPPTSMRRLLICTRLCWRRCERILQAGGRPAGWGRPRLRRPAGRARHPDPGCGRRVLAG